MAHHVADAQLQPAPRVGLRIVTMALGILLTSSALMLSPTSLLAALLPVTDNRSASLLIGARLFILMLGLLGAYAVAVASWLPVGRSFRASVARAPHTSVSIVLGIIVAVAAALIFHRLGAGLWYDEILMHVQYGSKSFGQLVTTYDSQNQHFLYTLLARWSIDAFGDTAWALRLPAALFGVAGVAALYYFARELTDASEALTASAILAFSYHHIWFSQNARGYTAVLFWTLLSSALLLRALRDHRRRLWGLYAVAAAAGVYTNLTMAFVMVGQGLVYLTRLWQQRRNLDPGSLDGFYLGFPLSLLLIGLLHALVLPQVLAGVVNESSVVPAWRQPAWAVLELVNSMGIGWPVTIAASIGLIVIAAGLADFVRSAPALVILLLVPIGLCAALVVGSGHHVWPRLFFFSLGFAIMGLVRGVRVCAYSAARRLNAVGWADVAEITASLVLVAGAILGVRGVYAPKQDYQGALTFIEGNRAPGDVITTAGLASLPYRQYYRTDWQPIDSVESLDRVRARGRRTWLVYTLPMHLDAVAPRLMQRIREEFLVIRIFPGTLSGGAIVVSRDGDAAGRAQDRR